MTLGIATGLKFVWNHRKKVVSRRLYTTAHYKVITWLSPLTMIVPFPRDPDQEPCETVQSSVAPMSGMSTDMASALKCAATRKLRSSQGVGKIPLMGPWRDGVWGRSGGHG